MSNGEGSKKGKEYYVSVIFMILTVIFWGLSFISTKVVLAEIPPVSIAFFRQFIALVPLMLWLMATGTLKKISWRDFGTISLSSFFGIVLYFVFENKGLTATSASNASMIVAAVPVFTLAAEAMFFKLKVSGKMLLCLLLSIVGVYLVITVNGTLDISSSTLFGNLLVIGAMVCWVIYTIISRNLSSTYSGGLIVMYQTLAGALLFIPFIIPEIPRWRMVSTVSMLNLLYLSIFCSALAYFLYIYAVKRLGAAVSSAFLNLIPVVSVVADYFIMHQSLTPIQAVGMGLVMLGLYNMSRK